MQNFLKVIALISMSFLCCCHAAREKQPDAEVRTEKELFFPVTDYLLGQLNVTDSLPVTPLKITIRGTQKDSLWLKKEDIRKFCYPFLHPVIDSISMVKYFSEKSFMDQTINAITFSYDAKTIVPDSIKLNHWDVYIDPQKNKVQRIYLVKEDAKDGKDVITQLTWKADKWCSIRTIIQQPNKDPEVKEEILKWDFSE